MRRDVGIARLDVGGQIDGDGGQLLALLATLLERQAHRIGVRHAARERLADGGLELAGAVALEQPQQGGGDGAEIVAARGGAAEQTLARRRRLG